MSQHKYYKYEEGSCSHSQAYIYKYTFNMYTILYLYIDNASLIFESTP